MILILKQVEVDKTFVISLIMKIYMWVVIKKIYKINQIIKQGLKATKWLM